MTASDPFASAPDEPQTAVETPAEQKPAVATAYVDVKPRFPEGLIPSNEIVTTFKGGAGYDQPWIVIHAASVAESDALLDQSLADYMGKVKKVAGFFNGGGSAPAQAASRPVQQGQPQGSVEAPSWAPPKPFDDFVYKTGVSAKNGKIWHAWMPPTRNDNRDAKFFYQN